jgi:hypothetical protein
MAKKHLMSVMGAISAIAGAPGVAAAASGEPAVPVATSYADLLQPIPNAVERLQRSDAEAAARPAQLIEAQYAPPPVAHHHHHHHHHHNRRWYLRHGYSWYGGAWVLRPAHHHHHHHHHQQDRY